MRGDSFHHGDPLFRGCKRPPEEACQLHERRCGADDDFAALAAASSGLKLQSQRKASNLLPVMPSADSKTVDLQHLVHDAEGRPRARYGRVRIVLDKNGIIRLEDVPAA